MIVKKRMTSRLVSLVYLGQRLVKLNRRSSPRTELAVRADPQSDAMILDQKNYARRLGECPLSRNESAGVVSARRFGPRCFELRCSSSLTMSNGRRGGPFSPATASHLPRSLLRSWRTGRSDPRYRQ